MRDSLKNKSHGKKGKPPREKRGDRKPFEKYCLVCKKWKDYRQFNKAGKNKTGQPRRRHICKDCLSRQRAHDKQRMKLEAIKYLGGKCEL